MRELLEKAHQEDQDDIFAEVEGDEEFQAPDDIRDVFLDEFADTDDEVEVDEEEAERELRREERRKVCPHLYRALLQLMVRPKAKARRTTLLQPSRQSKYA